MSDSKLDTSVSASDKGPTVRCFPHVNTATCVYVAYDALSKKAVIFDSCIDYDPDTGEYYFAHADQVLAFVASQGLDVKYIIDTHIHADHLTAGQYIRARLYYDRLVAAGKIDPKKTPLPTRYGEMIEAYGPGVVVASDVPAPLYVVGEGIPHVQEVLSAKIPQVATSVGPNQFDSFVKDGDTIVVEKDAFEIKVLYTPGHTSSCHSYLAGDALFPGDTMFMHDIGTARCDFPLGSAEQLWASLQRLLALPESTRVLLCHDYPAGKNREFTFLTSIGEQLDKNVHVKRGTIKEDYIKARKTRDSTLAPPKLIVPALAWNLAGGHITTDNPKANTPEDAGTPAAAGAGAAAPARPNFVQGLAR